jgi:hypothetical protein
MQTKPMPPTRRNLVARDTPPSNVAQLGMGWNIVTGTIDLGLALFDAILMIGEWTREYVKKKALKLKAAETLRRGKRPKQNQPRSIDLAQLGDPIHARW